MSVDEFPQRSPAAAVSGGPARRRLQAATARRVAPTPRQLVCAAAIVLAGALGFALGWGFGLRVGGPWGTWLAFVTALNGALLCSLLADWLLGRAAAAPAGGSGGSSRRPETAAPSV